MADLSVLRVGRTLPPKEIPWYSFMLEAEPKVTEGGQNDYVPSKFPRNLPGNLQGIYREISKKSTGKFTGNLPGNLQGIYREISKESIGKFTGNLPGNLQGIYREIYRESPDLWNSVTIYCTFLPQFYRAHQFSPRIQPLKYNLHIVVLRIKYEL